MRWLGLAVVLAACGFRPTPNNVTNDAELVTDAIIDGTPLPNDMDGDGVADDIDNCPTVPNPLQANEDGDDRGDACDLCPHLAGTFPGTDSDDDSDGIGNQCDPRPNNKDTLIVFAPFNNPSELTQFTAKSGLISSWSISNGQLHCNDAALANADQIVLTAANANIDGPVWVESAAHIDQLAAGTGVRLAAVSGAYTDNGAGDTDFYVCGVRSIDAGQPAYAESWHFTGPTTVDPDNPQQQSTTSVGAMQNGLHGHISLKATANDETHSTLACAALTQTVSQTVNGFTPAGPPGLRAYGATASFDYLFVVAIGTP